MDESQKKQVSDEFSGDPIDSVNTGEFFCVKHVMLVDKESVK